MSWASPFRPSICMTVLQVSMGISVTRKKPTTNAATTTSRPGPQLKFCSSTPTPSFAAVETNRDKGAWIRANATPE
eukprot:CAMPEP_0172547172 /NCGR_PEP_ID=MMETSP1067-20121228/16761_1 /TAXON_ID=265564 ORGANISM="Thalassiosira punctigera, Strain Tpunct2005C2" /NCGR_SAMPLE_ID=MMETSP1067 /ASSEMBLY_ACC=CAM_ASM_000444 /LENGTH=75 /DNA_ID=CAMNT_0013334209 /DNA_START=483 /DNA_END=710 /DNA_ORIENTATION=-